MQSHLQTVSHADVISFRYDRGIVPVQSVDGAELVQLYYHCISDVLQDCVSSCACILS